MTFLATLRRTLWTFRQYPASRQSPERVRTLQERRLRRLLRHAAASSPFYREKFRGLDLDRGRLSDLPTTNKAELMANFDRVVTDPAINRADLEAFMDDPENIGRLYRGQYPVCHTSGSQGQPMLVVQDPFALDLLFAFQMTRGNDGYRRLGPLEALRRVFEPARIAVIISKRGFFPSVWIWEHLPEPMRPYVKFLYLLGGDPQLIQKLNDFNPTVLTATPTTLDLLALKADQLRLTALRQVVPNSEVLTPAVRERIAETYRAPVLDNYACGECVFLGNGCPTDPGIHINADWAILEIVDEAGRPVPPGVLGHKAYLTNLANFTQPFIRYEVGDRLQLATTPCRCGSRLPRIERVVGRVAEVFWVETETGYRPLTAYPFQHSLEHFRQIREWQAIQEERNRVVLRLELLPNTTVEPERVRRRLEDRLALAGFQGEVEIDLELVPRLEWDERTGKFRRMISHVGPPEDLHQPREMAASGRG